MPNSIEKDLTGKNRMFCNALVSWSSHLVLIASGFILPRLMDQQLGQVELGSWDLCWSFVTYLKYVGLGVGGSSNRFVAKYRSENNITALSSLVSSVILIQFCVALLIFIAMLVIVYTIPFYFAEELGDQMPSIQAITFYLGCSLVATNLFSASRGLLTGHHRWDLHNILTASYSVLSVAFMITMLLLGYGIEGMAQAYLFNTIVFEFIRIAVSAKYCRDVKFSISFSMISKERCKQLILFATKNKLTSLPPIFILQSVNFMIVAAMGLSALAVFARSIALTRHVSTFMNKFTMLLTPSVSSMLAENKRAELVKFYLMTTRLSIAFTLPLVVSLALFGDIVVLYWMGPDYADQQLIFILALGILLPVSQDGSLRLLMGLNQHGKISVYLLIVILIVFAIFYLYSLNYEFTLVMAALALRVPMNLAYGFILPIYACKKINVSLFHYVTKTMFPPILAVLPFFILLLMGRFFYDQNEVRLTVLCLLLASITLVISYSLIIVNAHQREIFISKLFRKKSMD